MAQPTNTYATNDMIGIREDLSDVIYDISPSETPFISMVAREEAKATLHEWQTDALASAADNAVIEGDDATTDAATATVRRTNYTQISDKVAQVTGTARAVDTAGRADEMDYQMLKRSRELRRDMEVVLLQNTAKAAGSDSVARRLGGVPTWIATNDSFGGGGGASPTGDGSDTRTDGTQRAFTETLLKAVLLLCAAEGGMPDTLMLGSFNRQAFSAFTGGATNMRQAEDQKLHATVDVYVSDFGELKVVHNLFQRSRDGHVLQMDMWKVAFMPGREFAAWDLAKTGDTDRRQIISEYTLVAANEKASGLVADLTTS